MTAPESDRLLDRLRANARAAGVAVSEADIEQAQALGFLTRYAACQVLLDQLDVAALPDDLYRWSAPPAPPAAPPAPLPAAHSDTIAGIAPLISRRAVSPVELTRQALAAITARDGQQNTFQLVLAEQALAAARRCEQEIADGGYRGPLHGVPVAVKDLFDLAGTPTTAGSAILAGTIVAQDAAAVERLTAAGAVIIGKTRMSEFAYSPGSNNGHYGPTPNPHDRILDAGGSSSGSAAAVALQLVYAALGTDTGGSIRIPASYCQVVGLKPTYGRVSLRGVTPLSFGLDHAGPLTRSVADAALLLAALAGPDPGDPRTTGALPFVPPELDGDLSGLRVGVLLTDGGPPDVVAAALLKVAGAALAACGATLVPLALPELAELVLVNNALMAIDALAFHLPWLRTRLSEYGEFTRQRLIAALIYGPADHVRAQQSRAALRQRVMAALDGVDALILAATPGGPPPLGTPGPTRYTNPFNGLGWPAVVVPAPVGAPAVGVQVVARPWQDGLALRVARGLELAGS